jgi:perosamine synthetase
MRTKSSVLTIVKWLQIMKGLHGMWVRTQLKIGWLDLIATAARGLLPLDMAEERQRAETYFSGSQNAIACLSVRSGFDLLLQCLDLKPGDEVVFSALNVRAMIKVINNLGLVAVPVDIDLATMQPRMDRLRAAITSRSKVFVVAHLFGTRLDLREAFAFVKSKGLVTVEDCAQAFNGRDYQGTSLADIVMYSFGPIKTATALGGALLIVHDQGLRQRMMDTQNGYPVQASSQHRKRALKFLGLKAATLPPVLGAIFRYYRMRGMSYEDGLADKVRDVAPLKTVDKMRLQPSALMLWLMNRRLYRFDMQSLEHRAKKGRNLSTMISQAVHLPGQSSEHHDFWVFPMLVERPKEMIAALRDAGFDAADLPRSQHIAAPPDRPQLEPEAAANLMRDIVIVPCYGDMPDPEIERLAGVVRRVATGKT